MKVSKQSLQQSQLLHPPSAQDSTHINVAQSAPTACDEMFAGQSPQEVELWRRVLNDHIVVLPTAPMSPIKCYTSPRILAEDRTLNATHEEPGEHDYADSATFLDPNDPEQIKRYRFFQSFGPALAMPQKGLPSNPCGGSNVVGRGNLALWGPNPAADNLLFRWGPKGAQLDDKSDETRALQIALVQRRSGTWALPGGMVDIGEQFAQSASREAQEEMGLDAKFQWRSDDLTPFAGAVVFDPRNTQNAWMVTAAFMLHPDDARAQSHLESFIPSSTLLRGLGKETLDAQWFDVHWDSAKASGVNKQGERVHLDLDAVVISDPYKDNRYKPWVAQLAKPRQGMQAMFASHGQIMLSARTHM